MFFGVVADSVEDNADLAAQAVGVAHRTHNGVFDAIGVNRILPTAVKDLNDKVYDANENLVRETGRKTATLLRKFEGPYPSQPDSRDHIYKPDLERSLGHHVDLRSGCPEVYNQGHMMSCTAHAVAAAFEFDVIKQGLPEFSPSRLFIWYNARAKGNPGDTKKNVGSNLRDAIKSLDMRYHGVCSEEDWSYEVSKSDEKTHKFPPGAKAAMKPPISKKHAHQYTAPTYKTFEPENTAKALKHCLNEGYPFVFGMKTYGLLDRKYIGPDGRGLRDPKPNDMKDEHRHSLLAVGYKQEEKVFIVRNSWGADWGENGYFYMPYHWLKHCYDFWSIRLVQYKPEK
ncbi:cysteine proteinase [Daldinia bambusicola]|nr:cysteine proteinase [Daldinia bambusicola]